jgi:UDP-GlcNAc:undecaprenyl-phosphate GlcNAc-1-phosphate transferase
MISEFPIILFSLFFLCFIFSLLINHILLKFAQTLGVRNKEENQIRWNPNIKPAMGGISFYLIFLIDFIFILLLPHQSLGFNTQILGILIASTLAFLMGLADDAYNTQPLLKFLTQIFCAFIVIFSNHSITIFQNQYLNYFVTVLWVVGIMNSVNMLDNMDGITTIVCIVIAFFIISINISLKFTDNYITVLNVGVVGALIGFLIYNFHPSKMFMGDTGSQFLGLFFSVMGINNCWNSTGNISNVQFPYVNILIVLLVFLIPITDTSTVVFNRLRTGNSPFIGGKDHTTHHLFFRGITEKRIAILYFFIASVGAMLAYLLIVNFSDTLFFIALSYVILVFGTLFLNTIVRKK